jgi:hypothetical protein
MIAYDFDVDLAVFITPGFDFGGLWRRVTEKLSACGLRCIEYHPEKKFRISPEQPLVYSEWRERYQEARLENPGKGRACLSRIASQGAKAGNLIKNPNGSNCIDVEVYTVRPGAPVLIRGSETISVSTKDIFPIVEGCFGPLRIPLPRTPKILDAEYGGRWRQDRVCKVEVRREKTHDKSFKVDGQKVRRCVWPSVALTGCEPLLGGYCGAGLQPSKDDVPWRFF